MPYEAESAVASLVKRTQQRAIPMEKGSGGVWTASVKLPLGTHNYLFIVDGEWCDDPECPMRVPNPFGGYNMVRAHREPDVPHFEPMHRELAHAYFSEFTRPFEQ